MDRECCSPMEQSLAWCNVLIRTHMFRMSPAEVALAERCGTEHGQFTVLLRPCVSHSPHVVRPVEALWHRASPFTAFLRTRVSRFTDLTYGTVRKTSMKGYKSCTSMILGGNSISENSQSNQSVKGRFGTGSKKEYVAAKSRCFRMPGVRFPRILYFPQ